MPLCLLHDCVIVRSPGQVVGDVNPKEPECVAVQDRPAASFYNPEWVFVVFNFSLIIVFVRWAGLQSLV